MTELEALKRLKKIVADQQVICSRNLYEEVEQMNKWDRWGQPEVSAMHKPIIDYWSREIENRNGPVALWLEDRIKQLESKAAQ